MNASQMRSTCIRASIRRLLSKPAIAIRLAMLKLGMITHALDGLSIEAIPRYHLGIPEPGQYHICLRSTDGKGRLVADVEVEQHGFQGLNAYRIKVQRADLPSHAMHTLWLRREKAEP